jgi:hypothetical protein
LLPAFFWLGQRIAKIHVHFSIEHCPTRSKNGQPL